MNRTTLLWIVAGFLVWWFFLRSKLASAAATASAGTAPTVGTAPTASAGAGLTQAQSFVPFSQQQMAGWGGQTFTTQPSDAASGSSATSAAPSSAGATSFPGDDLMSLSQ